MLHPLSEAGQSVIEVTMPKPLRYFLWTMTGLGAAVAGSTAVGVLLRRAYNGARMVHRVIKTVDYELNRNSGGSIKDTTSKAADAATTNSEMIAQLQQGFLTLQEAQKQSHALFLTAMNAVRSEVTTLRVEFAKVELHKFNNTLQHSQTLKDEQRLVDAAKSGDLPVHPGEILKSTDLQPLENDVFSQPEGE